jgi:hypothetical protein
MNPSLLENPIMSGEPILSPSHWPNSCGTEETETRRRANHKLMTTYAGTSPNNVMDLWDLEHELRELRKAKGDDSNVKPRIASKEDVQRDQAVRMRLARVEQLANENYSIDEIAYLTGEPKFRIETDMEKVRARRREREKQKVIFYSP